MTEQLAFPKDGIPIGQGSKAFTSQRLRETCQPGDNLALA